MKLTTKKIVFINIIILVAWLIAHVAIGRILSSYTEVPASYITLAAGLLMIGTSSVFLFFAIRRQTSFFPRYANEYKSIFEASPFPLWIYDRETLKFIEVNKAAEDHYGYTRQEFLNMTILDIREQDERGKTEAAARDMPDSYKTSGYWEHIRKDGEVITVYITSRKITYRNRECVMVIAQDVTIQAMQEKKLNELYQAEQEHKRLLELHIKQLKETLEEKELLGQVIDRIHNIAIITDGSAKITWVNQAFVKHTGYLQDEVIGKTPYFLHGPKTAPETQEAISMALKNHEFRSFEILNYTKSGEEYWVDMTFSPIYDENNQVVRYISIQNVITDKKAIYEKIREQNKVLKNVAWTNSHALRKPVASIISLVQIGDEMDLPPDVREIHKLIGTCAEELDIISKKIAEKVKD